VIDILLNALVPIFAVMGLGFFAGWIRDVDNRHIAELNALVMDFALPASLFVAMATTPSAVLLSQWPLFVTFLVSYLLLYAVSYAMQRRLFRLGRRGNPSLDNRLSKQCGGRTAADRGCVRSRKHCLRGPVHCGRFNLLVPAYAGDPRGEQVP
jgi:auxin efflux family transporter